MFHQLHKFFPRASVSVGGGECKVASDQGLFVLVIIVLST